MKQTRKNKKLSGGMFGTKHDYVDFKKVNVGSVLTIKTEDVEMLIQIKKIIKELIDDIYRNKSDLDLLPIYTERLAFFLFLLKEEFEITNKYGSPERPCFKIENIINKEKFSELKAIRLCVDNDGKFKIFGENDREILRLYDSGIDLNNKEEGGSKNSTRKKKRKYHKK